MSSSESSSEGREPNDPLVGSEASPVAPDAKPPSPKLPTAVSQPHTPVVAAASKVREHQTLGKSASRSLSNQSYKAAQKKVHSKKAYIEDESDADVPIFEDGPGGDEEDSTEGPGGSDRHGSRRGNSSGRPPARGQKTPQVSGRSSASSSARYSSSPKAERKNLLGKDSQEYGAVPLEEVNLEDTFWYMKHRQWGRMYRTSYDNKPRGYFSFRWLLFYLVFFGAYLSVQLLRSPQVGTTLEYILMGFISVSLAIWTPALRWFLRVCAFECYLFFFIFCVWNMYNNANLYVPLGAAVGGLLIITVISWLIYPYVLRAFSKCYGKVTPKLLLDDNESGPTNRYELKQKLLCSAPYTCVYEGDLRKGKPHGEGTWVDTSYQGELLAGYWYKGIPVGPFESIENDTRNILVNLRIIYGSNSGGKWWLNRTPLTIGVACVEACVSGNFIKGYPIVKMITQPKECQCHKFDCHCIIDIFAKKHYRHFEEDRHVRTLTVSVDKKLKSLNVTGFRPKKGKAKNLTVTIKEEAGGVVALGVDEHWLSQKSTEGLLFIHGINHNLEDTLKRFGQFLALGHFPSYLKPLVFNWPSSAGPFLYWCAQTVASDNDNHRDLKRFMRSIKQSGISTLHVMCHSMGSRLFLRAFPVIRDLFKRRRLDDDSEPSSVNLSEAEGDAPRSGDSSSSSKRSQAPSRSRYSTRINEEDQMQLANLILLNPDYEVDTFRNDHEELAQYCHSITIYADRRDVALKVAFRLNQKKSLGSHTDALTSEDGTTLDVDIVDTGDLDRNINGQYHGYFNINRVMVDDLWELIVTGKRAEDRTSRLKSYGNVYRFTMVPSSVVMV